MANIFDDWFTPEEWSKRNLKGSNLSKIFIAGDIKNTVKWGFLFRQFHGLLNYDGLVLDVGSGSGLYRGRPYAETNYCYYEGNKVNLDPFILIPVDKGVIGVGEAIPFRSGVFDSELCVSALRHMINLSEAAKEMHRVLKHGSHLFIGCEFGRGSDSYHLHNPSASKVKEIFESHFRLKRVTAEEIDGELRFDNHIFYMREMCIFDFLKE